MVNNNQISNTSLAREPPVDNNSRNLPSHFLDQRAKTSSRKPEPLVEAVKA